MIHGPGQTAFFPQNYIWLWVRIDNGGRIELEPVAHAVATPKSLLFPCHRHDICEAAE
jgi:hypothetical protein